jgi:hypothetical protein
VILSENLKFPVLCQLIDIANIFMLCYKVFTLEASSGLIKSPISSIDQYAKVSFGSPNWTLSISG